MDGRDIGTVVLPQAEVKIFLTASPEIRAQRRMKELEQRGTPQPYNQVLSDILQRDWADTPPGDGTPAAGGGRCAAWIPAIWTLTRAGRPCCT